MKIHTFLDKCATIVSGTPLNFGLNPVAELNMGRMVSRACIHFNTDHLKALYEDHTIADIEKTKHILKLTNCTSVNINDHERVYAGLTDGDGKERAASFDVILFTLPKDFDEGKGFSFHDTTWISSNERKSLDGCSWYKCRNLVPWKGEDDDPESHYDDGIYDIEYIYSEYKKYLNTGESDIIVASQHFDFGAENFELDVTDYVNGIITGLTFNHGLCLMFSPDYETYPFKEQKYVGFFTNHTTLFFEPYLETTYSEYINDDRAKFYAGKENKLYLYCSVNGDFVNLDKLPTCTIEGVEYPVKQATKGVYYATVKIEDAESDSILSDVWSGLSVDGEPIEDIEMEFTVLAKKSYFKIGKNIVEKKELVPSLSGINDAEKIRIGDIRRVDVSFRTEYVKNSAELFDKAEYRIYTKDASREIDVYEYSPIETAYLDNYFVVDTNEMVPGDYFVDVKISSGLDTRVFKNILRFTVASNITEFYR